VDQVLLLSGAFPATWLDHRSSRASSHAAERCERYSAVCLALGHLDLRVAIEPTLAIAALPEFVVELRGPASQASGTCTEARNRRNSTPSASDIPTSLTADQYRFCKNARWLSSSSNKQTTHRPGSRHPKCSGSWSTSPIRARPRREWAAVAVLRARQGGEHAVGRWVPQALLASAVWYGLQPRAAHAAQQQNTMTLATGRNRDGVDLDPPDACRSKPPWQLTKRPLSPVVRAPAPRMDVHELPSIRHGQPDRSRRALVARLPRPAHGCATVWELGGDEHALGHRAPVMSRRSTTSSWARLKYRR